MMRPRPRPQPRESAAEYHRRYEQFKKEGRTFWPDIIFEDTIAALIVLAIILGLTLVLGMPLGNVADPTNRTFVPRPEWYFMSLFQFLMYFPGNLEWLGVILPGVALILVLFWPFLAQVRPRLSWRHPLTPSVVAVSLAVILVLTYLSYQRTPTAAEEGMATKLTGLQQRGRTIFLSQTCLSCHQLNGAGQGIPLDGVGERLDAEQLHNYIAYPRLTNPNAAMPNFSEMLSHREIEAIASYLATLKSGGAGK